MKLKSTIFTINDIKNIYNIMGDLQTKAEVDHQVQVLTKSAYGYSAHAKFYIICSVGSMASFVIASR